MDQSLVRRLAAEAIGSAFLLATVVGSTVRTHDSAAPSGLDPFGDRSRPSTLGSAATPGAARPVGNGKAE